MLVGGQPGVRLTRGFRSFFLLVNFLVFSIFPPKLEYVRKPALHGRQTFSSGIFIYQNTEKVYTLFLKIRTSKF